MILQSSGPASAPTDLSVVCDPPSAVVSFKSPVYGGECVDHYIVTAVSEGEEKTVSCNTTRGDPGHNCSISLNGSANDYNFTVYAVTRVNDSFIFNGLFATDCCRSLGLFPLLMHIPNAGLEFPESVAVEEILCGLKYLLKTSWEVYNHFTYHLT